AELLKVLANENRLLVFCALMEKSLTVGEIAKHVPNITQSALSQHLTLLKAYGILGCKKSGQNVNYSIVDKRAGKIINVIKKYYCNTEEA
ncbi:MAG: metalloregulator ArsR/SmtB family transcription factor, partial [Treponema sp.]|nr:metalloregulator ArsR/SmtB family transcription factor [Treponema sp.]